MIKKTNGFFDITASTGVAAAGGSRASVSAAAPMDDDDGEETILVNLHANDGGI